MAKSIGDAAWDCGFRLLTVRCFLLFEQAPITQLVDEVKRRFWIVTEIFNQVLGGGWTLTT